MDIPDRFVEAVAHVPEPPCSMGGRCPYWRQCATEKLACHEFYAYVNRDRYQDNRMGLSMPTRLIYLGIYETKSGGMRHRGVSVYAA